MVHFVGAGCGAPDLITLRGRRLLEEADVIIYAGSLVNPALLGFAKKRLQNLQQRADDAGRSDCRHGRGGKQTADDSAAAYG